MVSMGAGAEAEALLPGFKTLGSTDTTETAGILIAGGTVIHPQRYVQALWRACQQAAARGAFCVPIPRETRPW
jgi:glycine/D-amino acid oxidase-like deaminating enzyme